MNKTEITVFFAKLWGIVTTEARKDETLYEYLESFDCSKLVNLLSSWAEEYIKVHTPGELEKEVGDKEADEDNACCFFFEKLEQLCDHLPDFN